MRLSHSRIETFKKCPYQFRLKYIDSLKTLPTDDPANALIIGHALHTGIEKDIKAAIAEYYAAFPIITDRHVEEAIKLEYWIQKIKSVIPTGGKHEVPIADSDFIGFIDYLVPVGGGQYDVYDWKYSNNIEKYSESAQLHLYKYYFEKTHPGKKIRSMFFAFVPKTQLRIKYKNKKNRRDETIREFRQRIYADMEFKEIRFVKIDYDAEKVIEFLQSGIRAINCTDYTKNPTNLCAWCEFKKFCESEDDVDMALPSTQRRKIEGNTFKKIWFYGMPFSGKTYLANQFDVPLMLNTDGNFKQVDAPVIRIIDEVTTEGRITKRKYAWDVFKEAVDDLEKGSEFKTIIVDLLEDVYDACRVKVCVDNGWDHESDDSFKAYDIVRSEFLRTLKRLLNLPYNVVLISHEDTSRDIMRKSGDKITAIKPNLNDKLALKFAGMVDIACRIVNDNDKRTIRFKSSEVEFGGGRLTISVNEIPCEYSELMKVYADDLQKQVEKSVETEVHHTETVESVETATAEPEVTEIHERSTRTRKTRIADPEEVAKEVEKVSDMLESAEAVEVPRRKKRKKQNDFEEVVEDGEVPF